MAVDRKYAVEIAGQGYILANNQYAMEFDETFLAPQSLVNNRGSAPAGSFWHQRRYTDWVAGYNQKMLESETSVPNKFLDSSGMDISTPGEFKQLPKTTVSLATGVTEPLLHVGLGKLWMSANTNVHHTTDGITWTGPVATGVSGNISQITDDGASLYVFGTGGNVRTGSTGAYSNFHTGGVAPTKGFVWHNNQLYGNNAQFFTRIESGADFSNIFNPGSGFRTDTIIEHENKLAFVIKRGTGTEAKSYIYESDGTTGGTTVLIDDIPLGFTVRGLFSYSDILWIYGGYDFSSSTSNGGLFAFTQSQLRYVADFAETAHVGDPNPRVAPTIDTSPRTAFAQGQFVYFGMNEGTGLWRYDLKEGGLSRTYSIQSGTALVTGVAVFKGVVFMSAAALGAYKETTTFPSTSSITLSTTTIDNSNAKLGRKITIIGRNLSGVATVIYSPSALPAAATPAWTRAVTGSPSDSISNGLLTVDIGAAEKLNYKRDTLGLANATGWTVEARMQTDDVTSDNGLDHQGIQVRDDTYKASIEIFKNKVNFKGGASTSTIVMDTTDAEHEYRITAKDGVQKLYINKILKATVTQTIAQTNNDIFWADVAGGQAARAKATWRYLLYAANGAFSPDQYVFTTNPVLVEVSNDQGKTFRMLPADTQFKNYDLSTIPEWDSLLTKITISDSDMLITDVVIEAVPTLPTIRKWELNIDLYSDMDTLNGASERIDSQVLYEQLEAARVNKTIITFKDIDFDIATNPTVRKVLIEELKRGNVEVVDQDVENVVRLKLREV